MGCGRSQRGRGSLYFPVTQPCDHRSLSFNKDPSHDLWGCGLKAEYLSDLVKT